MKVLGQKLGKIFTPLTLTGGINILGGNNVQFWDGNSYIPNREGTPSSPLLIVHHVDVVNPDEQAEGELTFTKVTKYYENDVLITSSTPKYSLIDDKLRVEKNIPAGKAVTIRAVTQLIDTRNGNIYERIDITYLRTITKTPDALQLVITPNGTVTFDGFRNPNTKTTVTATVRQYDEEITDYSGLTFKWLNSEGKDAIEYELYGDEVSSDGRTITIDKKFIDKDTLHCEVWRDGNLIDKDTVTFLRGFRSCHQSVDTPGLPLMPGIKSLICTFYAQDALGPIDVNEAFLVVWMITENGVDRELGTGSPFELSESSINWDANPQIWVDARRREAWAALVDSDGSLLTSDGAVLVVETYGK